MHFGLFKINYAITILSLDLITYPSTDICSPSRPVDRSDRPKAFRIRAYKLKIHFTSQQISYLPILNANRVAAYDLPNTTQFNKS